MGHRACKAFLYAPLAAAAVLVVAVCLPMAAAVSSASPEPSACRVDTRLRVDPARVQVGDGVTVSHGIDVSCPAPPTHIALVLDGSSAMAGAPHQRMVDAMRHLVRRLDLSAHPETRIGVVEFSSAATTLIGLTNDEASVLEAIGRVQATDGSRIERGLQEAGSLLAAGRGARRDDLVEIVVLVAWGGPMAGCEPVLDAARELENRGARIVTAAVCPDCDYACLYGAASQAWLSGKLGDGAWLADTLAQLAAQQAIPLTRLVISGTLASGLAFVPGSDEPEMAVTPADGRPYVWEIPDPSLGTTTYTLQVRPARAAKRLVPAAASGVVTDSVGRARSFLFPRSDLEVVDPHVPSPTPSTTSTPRAVASPTPTTGTFGPRVFLPIFVRCRPRVPDPLDVVVVLDASPSMAEPAAPGGPSKIDMARSHALALAERFGGAFPDRVAVLEAGAQPVLRQGLTRDVEELRRAIGEVDIRAPSRLDLAIDAARRELAGERQRIDARRLVVLISDGRVDDPQAVVRTAEAARSEGVALASIAVGDDADRGVLAQVTPGGWAVADIDPLIEKIRELLCRCRPIRGRLGCC